MRRPKGNMDFICWRIILIICLAGCRSPREAPPTTQKTPDNEREKKSVEETLIKPEKSFTITSPAFKQGQKIPSKYTGEGEDVSPALAWTDLPVGTRSIALFCDDPDAPGPEPWVHWVAYDILPDWQTLPEGKPKGRISKEIAGIKLGKNSWGAPGYRGPYPPKGHGVHLYRFRVYALDAPPDLPPGASKSQLLEAMKGHILARGELMGTYER